MSWPNTPIRAPLSSGQTGALRGGGPSEKQEVKRLRQVIGADLISVAGHSLRLHQTPIEGRCSRILMRREQRCPQAPRPRNSSVPSSRSSQCSGLWPVASPVSGRLGGGAATGHLVTAHQGGERERRSNHCLRLRAFCPDVPVPSVLYIRKKHQEGSPLCEPVRPRAPSLPSAVTRSQSVGDQRLVSA